jgi:hypothetical protein
MLPLLRLGNTTPEEQLRLLEGAILYSDFPEDEKQMALENVKREREILEREGYLIERIFNRLNVQRRLRRSLERVKKTTQRLSQDLAFQEFDAAIKAGLLTIHSFHTLEKADVATKGFYSALSETTVALVKEFIQAVSQSVSNGSTFPLFDDATLSELERRVHEGRLSFEEFTCGSIKTCSTRW